MPPLDNQEYEPRIPDAVRRQAERADELARENGLTGVSENEDPSETPVETEATPESEPAPSPAPAAEPVADWEQRYRTLQGKYDTEVPGLRSELTSIRQLLAEMNAPRPEPTESRPITSTTVVSPEHVETYGQELIDATRQWARAEIAPELEALRNQMAELRGGQQRVETMTSQQRVEAHLSSDSVLASRWQGLNEDPEFIAWLNQADPYTGTSRMTFFRDACGRGDGDRVGRFFKGYIAEHTAVNQPSPTPPLQTPAPGEPVAERTSLEELAAPGRAAGTGSSQGGAPAEKRLWTQPDIARFYDDLRRGRYAGREAVANALEQDIFAAPREGRIR